MRRTQEHMEEVQEAFGIGCEAGEAIVYDRKHGIRDRKVVFAKVRRTGFLWGFLCGVVVGWMAGLLGC